MDLIRWGLWNAEDRTPRSSVSEEDNEWSVEVELPGVKANDVSVEVNKKIMTIASDRKDSRRGTSFYYKRYVLPEGVDEGTISASLRDGILTVTIPKKEVASARKIEVRTD